MMSEQWNVYESFQALLQAGPYHFALEGILIIWIIWLLAKNPRKSAIKLSKKEEEQLLAEWMPEPLVPNPVDPSHPALSPRIVEGKVGLRIIVDGQEMLNLASHNYLNLSERPELEETSLKCLNTYGVGSCGPRGFYGTTEVHLDLEEKISEFYGTEKSVLYSYGFSTIASAIPAYSKKGDVIFADEMVNFPIQRGLDASRSRVVFFRHNDMSHLSDLLDEQVKLDKKNTKKAAATRRFLVVEGIYMNTGSICPLPELVELRKKHKLRLFLDESVSFGTIGRNARGVTDHFDVPMIEVDLLMATLENAAAGAGGFCTGTKYVIEHQRLSGLGYCFSASLPPMLAASSIMAIDILENEGGDFVMNLQEKCSKVHEAFSNLSKKMCIEGNIISPIKHLHLVERLDDRQEEETILREIVAMAGNEGLAIVMAAHLYCAGHPPLPQPSIRIAINKDLTEDDIKFAQQVLTKVLEHVLEQDSVPVQ